MIQRNKLIQQGKKYGATFILNALMKQSSTEPTRRRTTKQTKNQVETFCNQKSSKYKEVSAGGFKELWIRKFPFKRDAISWIKS